MKETLDEASRSNLNAETHAYEDSNVVRLNTTIRGEPAEILLELKRRGIVRSTADAFVQGIFALYKTVVDRDLALARLKTLGSENE